MILTSQVLHHLAGHGSGVQEVQAADSCRQLVASTRPEFDEAVLDP